MSEHDEVRDFQEMDLPDDLYHPPLWMALLFCVTMLAIYFMGRSVSGFYETPTPPLMTQTS